MNVGKLIEDVLSGLSEGDRDSVLAMVAARFGWGLQRSLTHGVGGGAGGAAVPLQALTATEVMRLQDDLAKKSRIQAQAKAAFEAIANAPSPTLSPKPSLEEAKEQVMKMAKLQELFDQAGVGRKEMPKSGRVDWGKALKKGE